MTENKKDLLRFLSNIEKFYAPKHPEAKDGVGHENEHIKGVITRSAEMCDVINNNQQIFGYKLEKSIATTLACLHDIGNVITRDMHNFVGEAIFKGELTAKHIVKHSYGKFNKKDREKLSKLVDSVEMDEISFYDLPEKTQKFLAKAYTAVIKYHMGMDGYKGKSVTEMDFEKFALGIIPNKSIIDAVKAEMINDETGMFKSNDAQYVPQLKGLIRDFNSLYPKGTPSRNVILAGIREHNVDFELNKDNIEKRFISEHKYSRLIADADKDNVPETFAIRTMLFAQNKLGVVNEKFMTTSNDIKEVNIAKCLLHVPHQARERFGYSKMEWRRLSGDKTAEHQPIFTDAIIDFDKENGYKRLKDAKFFDVKTGGISGRPGDDIFSQQEAFIKNQKKINTQVISTLRAPAVNKAREWSRVDMLDKTLTEMQKIYAVLMNSQSVEAAVDYFESQYYRSENRNFDNVVINALQETKPSLSVMNELTKEFMDSIIKIDVRDLRLCQSNQDMRETRITLDESYAL